MFGAIKKPIRIYTYLTTAGKTKRIEADHVEFQPGHVVFMIEPGGHIVAAEHNADINELRELNEDHDNNT